MLFRLRQQKQIGNQPAHSFAFFPDNGEKMILFGLFSPLTGICRRQDDGKRCAQLMGGGGHKSHLVLPAFFHRNQKPAGELPGKEKEKDTSDCHQGQKQDPLLQDTGIQFGERL